jgi:hypothetical protein
MMKATRMLVLALALFASSPALAQSVEVKDLRTGAAVTMGVDAPVRLVLSNDRVPNPARYRRHCPYSQQYGRHGYYERFDYGAAHGRRPLDRLVSFVAAFIIGFSVISMVRSLERWRASL